MNLAYADPPYLGQCGKRYEHFHNDGGSLPFDGLCWDERATQQILLDYLRDEFPDGWAYSCNPADLEHMNWNGGRVAVWAKTFAQIRRVPTQWFWEPVIFHASRKFSRKPMVLDWMSCSRMNRTGTHGAKPEKFNRWVLELLCWEPTDDLVDLFTGSGGMYAVLTAPPTEAT